jgi:hypothetical protein
MGWLIYRGSERENSPNRPYVSITPGGRIAINSVLTEQIVGWKFAELWYEDNRDVLGIKLVRERSHRGVCAITPCKAGRIISCRGIIVENEIEVDKPTKYQAEYVPSKRFILVYLRKPIARKQRGVPR